MYFTYVSTLVLFKVFVLLLKEEVVRSLTTVTQNLHVKDCKKGFFKVIITKAECQILGQSSQSNNLQTYEDTLACLIYV